MTKTTIFRTVLVAFLSLITTLTFAQGMTENFDAPSPSGAYGGATVAYTSGSWYVAAYTTPTAGSDHYNGTHVIRMRDVNHQTAMNFDVSGAGTVSFQYGSYGSHSGGIIRLQKSTDQADALAGTGTWTNVGDSILVPSWTEAGSALLEASFPVNIQENVRFRIIKMNTKNAANGSASVCVDDLKVTAYGVEAVATPSFSIEPGVYTSTQTVSINSATDGASIYYTIDGSEPSSASNLYASPLSVGTTTTIKAIAVKDGMTNSAVASATYSFPATISTLSALVALMPETGATTDSYQYTGEAVVIFSAISSTGVRTITVQDETGGIQIYDSNKKLTVDYNVGDKVSGFMGTVVNYNTLPEFFPVGDFTVVSTSNLISPKTVTIADLSSNINQLVKINGVSFTDSGVAFEKSTNYAITDETGASTFRAGFDFDYIGTLIPSTADLVAVVGVYRDSPQIFARSSADFLEDTATATAFVLETQPKAYSVAGELKLHSVDTISVTILNIAGQKIKDLYFSGSTSVELAAGIYLLQTDNSVQKVIVK